MIIFILGFITGATLFFMARIADKELTRVVERYGKTGSFTARKPIIIEGTDPTQEFIDQNFETIKE